MISACPACAAAPLAQDIAMAQPMMQFSLPTIHCAACIGKIERGLKMISGVETVRVNLSMKRLAVAGDIAPAQVLSALSDLGFEAYPLDSLSGRVLRMPRAICST